MSERIAELPIGSDEVVRDSDSGGSDGGNDAGNVIDPGSVDSGKRGRGRPRKSDAGSGGTDSGRKSKGRAASGSGSRKAPPATVSVDALAYIVGLVGSFVAARAKSEALALDDDEQRKIAEAAAKVASHYHVPVSEKTAAWIGLATVTGSIYGAKIAALKMARKMNS